MYINLETVSTVAANGTSWGCLIYNFLVMFRGLRRHTNTMVFHGCKAVREYSVINTPSPKNLKKPRENKSDYKYPGKTITEKDRSRISIILVLARLRFIWAPKILFKLIQMLLNWSLSRDIQHSGQVWGRMEFMYSIPRLTMARMPN